MILKEPLFSFLFTDLLYSEIFHVLGYFLSKYLRFQIDRTFYRITLIRCDVDFTHAVIISGTRHHGICVNANFHKKLMQSSEEPDLFDFSFATIHVVW